MHKECCILKPVGGSRCSDASSPAPPHREAFSLSSLRTRARKHRLPPQTNPFFLTMRLHLPKALLAAVLAACLAWPAGAFTSTTTNYPTDSDTPTTFNGDIWTWNNSGTNIGSGDGAEFTNYSTGTEYAGNDDITGPGKFYNYFFKDISKDYLGNTLRFSGATENKTLMTDWENYVWIGGLIADSSSFTYTLGRDGKTNFKLTGTKDVNMLIDSDFTFKTGNQYTVSVEKGGTWSIAKGKSLTFDTGTTTIVAGQMVNVSASGDGTENASLTFSGAVTNAGTINIGKGVNMTVSGGMNIDGALYNSGLFTNNGTSTINGSYTGTTITQTGDSATLTLASNSKVNMGSMTASFGTGRDDSASGLQSYEASYTIANGGTITNDGAVFRVGGETFTGNLSGGVYTITESRYNILAGETKSMQEVVNAIGGSTGSYYTNVIGSATEGVPDGTLTGVSDTTLTHGISGNGIIQVDTDTSLSYSKILDKAVEFTGSISVLGTLTGVVDSVLPHTIQGDGTVQVDENGTLSYAAFKKKASEFSGSINVVGLLSGVTDASLTHIVTGTGAIQVDKGDTLSYSKINEKAGGFTGSINVLGTLTGVSESSLTRTITGDGVVQVDDDNTLSYSAFNSKASSFTGGINVLGTLTGIDGTTSTTTRTITGTGTSVVTGTLEYNGGSHTFLDKFSGTLEIGNKGFLKLGNTTSKLENLSTLQVTTGGNVGGHGNVKVHDNVTLELAGGTLTTTGGSMNYTGKIQVTENSTFDIGSFNITVSGKIEIASGKSIVVNAGTGSTCMKRDGFDYIGTTLQTPDSTKNFSLYDNAIVTGGTLKQTDNTNVTYPYKLIAGTLTNVKLVNTATLETWLTADDTLSAIDIGGKLVVKSDTSVSGVASVTGTLEVDSGKSLKLTGQDTTSSIATLTGSGTLKTTGGTTTVTNASGFSGTLEATGGSLTANGTTTGDSGDVILGSLSGLKATGGSIVLEEVAPTLTVTDLVVSDGGSIIGAESYTADNVGIGKGAAGSLVGNLSIKNNGTITLDASAGITGTGLSLSSPITNLADEGSATTTGSLTLGSGLTLNLANLGRLAQGESLTLFSGVTEVIGLTDENLTALGQGTLAAETVFNGVGTGNYNLRYSDNIVSIVAQRDTPEPTTATLSLLALMALAARRRRKA